MYSEDSVIPAAVEKIREMIEAGAFGDADSPHGLMSRMPGYSELGKTLKMPRAVVTAAIYELATEGLVLFLDLRQFYAAPKKIKVPGLTKNFMEYLRGKGVDPYEENLIDPQRLDMPPQTARLFGVDPQTVVFRRRVQGRKLPGGKSVLIPYRSSEIYYSGGLVTDEMMAEMQSDASYDGVGAIARAGAVVVRCEDSLVSRFPTPDERETLDITWRNPVVELRRANYTHDDKVVFWNRQVWNANFVEFNYHYPVKHWSTISS